MKSAHAVRVTVKGGDILVDECDVAFASEPGWYLRNDGSVLRWIGTSKNPPRRCEYLHRTIMNAPLGKVVDHIDCDRTNNTRANLRICTESANMANRRGYGTTSRYKGVYWDKWTSRWAAQIYPGGRTVYLGRFTDEIAAARAYDDAARKSFGAFARLNFPRAGEQAAVKHGEGAA